MCGWYVPVRQPRGFKPDRHRGGCGVIARYLHPACREKLELGAGGVVRAGGAGRQRWPHPDRCRWRTISWSGEPMQVAAVGCHRTRVVAHVLATTCPAISAWWSETASSTRSSPAAAITDQPSWVDRLPQQGWASALQGPTPWMSTGMQHRQSRRYVFRRRGDLRFRVASTLHRTISTMTGIVDVAGPADQVGIDAPPERIGLFWRASFPEPILDR